MARKTQVKVKVADHTVMGDEPLINGTPSNIQLIKALNWYNYFHTVKDSKKWVLEYMKKTGYTKSQIAKYSASTSNKITQTLCSTARLLNRGAVFPNKLDEHIEEIIAEKKKTVKKNNVIQFPEVNNVIAIIDDYLDTFYSTNFNSRFEVASITHLIKECKPTEFKIAINYYSALLEELNSISSDKELQEGYKHLKKAQLNKYIKIVESILSDLESLSVNVKRRKESVRKTGPRKKKLKTEDQIFMKFNYAQNSAEYDLISIQPNKILVSSILWTFNVKTRSLNCYIAEDGKTFEVKGSTLYNVDTAKSFKKKIRKPEEVLPFVMKDGKAMVSKKVKALKTTETEAKPRINSDTILLRVFK